MSILDIFGIRAKATKPTQEAPTSPARKPKYGFYHKIFGVSSQTDRIEPSQITPELLARLDEVLPGDYLEEDYVPARIEVKGEIIDGPRRTWDELCDSVYHLLQTATYPEDTPAAIEAAKPEYLAMLYPKYANAAAKRMRSYAAFFEDARRGFRWGASREIMSFTHPLAHNASLRGTTKRMTPQLWKVCRSCHIPIRVSHETCPFCAQLEFYGDERNVIIAAQSEAEQTIKGILRNDWNNPATWDGLITARPYGDDEIIVDPIEVVRQTHVPRLGLILKFSLKGWPVIGAIHVDYSWCRGNAVMERNAEYAAEKHNKAMQAESIARRYARAKRLGLL